MIQASQWERGKVGRRLFNFSFGDDEIRNEMKRGWDICLCLPMQDVVTVPPFVIHCVWRDDSHELPVQAQGELISNIILSAHCPR
jgi:hypothetical protein